MRMLLVAGLLALLVVATVGPAGATPAPRGSTASKESKALLRLASSLSGVRAKRPVPLVRERPRRLRKRQVSQAAAVDVVSAHEATVLRALGLVPTRTRSALAHRRWRTALYDPSRRRVYATSLGKGNRKALVAAYVNALQDQAFRVAKRSRAVAADRDASWAARGAIDGHAAFVSSRLGGRLAEPGTPGRLERFFALRAAFPTTVGLRLAADLHELGGNSAIFSALRRFPATTEQVFHLDKFLERERALRVSLPAEAAGLELAGSQTWGELDTRALLAVHGVPRLGEAATGWGGGRSAIYRGAGVEAVTLALDWDSERDAAQWSEAVATFVDEAFDAVSPGRPAPVACPATTCWSAGGRGVAFQRNGARTAFVVTADAALAAELARTVVAEPSTSGRE